MAEGARGSFRSIVQATSLLGGATLANVLISLLKTKIAALLLGPVGIGLIGLLQGLLNAASAVASLGINATGTREVAVAAAEQDEIALKRAIGALFWGALLLACLGAGLFWLARSLLAELIVGDRRTAEMVGWLAIGLFAMVMTGGQVALLSGLRQIKSIAAITILTALLSVLIASAALLTLPQDAAIIVYLLSFPIMNVIIGQIFLARQPNARPGRIPIRILKEHWRGMARVGFWYTGTGILGASLALAVRAQLNQTLGAFELGQFQAAWTISSMYLAFILQSLGSDYFPRLSAAVGDREATNRIVNEQAEALLIMAAPAIFAVLGGAPLVLQLLYSSAFQDAAWVLRWQVLGDVFKLMVWPLSFVLLAAGAGRTFFFSEAFASIFLFVFIWVTLPLLGLVASGLGFVVMYGVHLALVLWILRRRIGFRWSADTLRAFAVTLAVSGAILLAAALSELLALALGVFAAAIGGVYVAKRLWAIDLVPARIFKRR